MKPHEEQWENGTDGAVWRKGSIADLVHVPPPGSASPREHLLARGRFIAAAPAMARALLDLYKNYECGERADAMIAAALKEAKVLE
jgi:hypothetical protein